MAPLDLTGGLAELSADAPAGPNLELDPDFGALERAAQGKAEQQYGGTIIPAEEPNWKDVAAQADALLDRTRDLRVLASLAVARLHLSGLTEFTAVLTAIRTVLEGQWEHVHPQLDPEDDNDPTLRANALLQLADPGRVLRFVRDMPLAGTPRTQRVSWRDIGIATGAITTEGDAGKEKLAETTIRGVFAETPPATIAALREAAHAGARELTAIPAVFDARSGAGSGPDLSELAKLLHEIERYVGRYAAVVDAASDAGEAAPADGEAAGEAAAGPRQGGVSAASLTSVATRADALRLLDIVCRYYEQNEPSSPLPLLIGRARKLADKGFLEILQDLAPDGVMQAQSVVQSRDG